MSCEPREQNASGTGRPDGPLAALDDAVFSECVHCGLCTSACPTYTELGDENDGPRGRIYLMRLASEGRVPVDDHVRRHLDRCLDCRACETACPSGVRYGRLIEPFRLQLEARDRRIDKRWDLFRHLVLLRLFPYRRRIRRVLGPVRVLQRLGIYQTAERLGLFPLLPGRLGPMASLVGPPVPSGPPLPRFLPAVGRRRARVAFFVGCVADALFRHVHWATLRVLQENGCDVLVPEDQVCCGAIHYHSGSRDGARQLADANVRAFDLEDIDAVVVNHAGCGAMLKEYGIHWDDARQRARQRLADQVQDVHPFLDRLGLLPPTARIDAVATYHDACHLRHAQQVAQAPRRLLAQIPGLQLRPLPESEICCGSAGTYNLNQPEMADRLGRRKADHILATGADIVLAANAGCLLQIDRYLRQQQAPVAVMHPMELLDQGYQNPRTPAFPG